MVKAKRSPPIGQVRWLGHRDARAGGRAGRQQQRQREQSAAHQLVTAGAISGKRGISTGKLEPSAATMK